MAGILSRFKTIMESNINALLDKAEDPVKMADQLVRDLEDDLGKVKAETASIMAEEKRAKRAYDDCLAEVEKLQKYAEMAVMKGADGDAKTFLSQKAAKAETLTSLKTAYELALTNAEKMKEMHDKLTEQIREINVRKASIKAKAAVAKTQERINKMGQSISGAADNLSAFDKLEEKVNRKMDEAEAMHELNAQKSGIEDLMSKYDKEEAPALEDELAALKAKLGK